MKIYVFYFPLRLFKITKAVHAYKNANNIKVFKVTFYSSAYPPNSQVLEVITFNCLVCVPLRVSQQECYWYFGWDSFLVCRAVMFIDKLLASCPLPS